MQDGDGTGNFTGRTIGARLAPLLLILALSAVYLLGLHPGVDAGDSAEIQLDSPLLGICHPPGYQVEITIGKIWSVLPIGGSVAWRLNLLMAIAGVSGCLALYAGVRRITGQLLPGIVSAMILGLSSVYWSHCLVAEAYVFYAAFLLFGFYCAVRFIESDRARWLFLCALSVGVAIGDRPSELFILPAFAILGFSLRGRFRLGRTRALTALVLFALPFAFSVTCYLVRNQPERLAIRDDAQRDEILQDVSKEISRGYGPNPTALGRVSKAVTYCLGATWVGKPGFRPAAAGRTIADYASILLGARAFAGAPAPEEEDLSHAGKRGCSIGIVGLLLVALATRRVRERRAWVLFGWALFAGNLLFILWHHSWDNMTFTVPGVAGLALLAGLGASRPAEGDGSRARTRGRAALAIAAALFLLLGNFRTVTRRGEIDQHKLEFCRQIGLASWPEKSVILCSYWPAMTFRYLFYVERGRQDMQVLCAEPSNYMKLIRHFAAEGRSIYLLADEVAAARRGTLEQATQPELARLGFVLANPVAQAEGR
jgi:hypothetical protein